MTAAGNQVGIFIATGASNNQIGGTTVPDRNVITGNTLAIQIDGASNRVYGNYIGIGAGGTGGSNGAGIVVNGASNSIGTTTPGAGNVIGNTTVLTPTRAPGVQINGVASNVVIGNIIGLEPGGMVLASNAGSGIVLAGADLTQVRGNVISGNQQHGVWVNGATNTVLTAT